MCCEYPPGPHGGIGTFTQVLARALVASGHRVRVVGLYPPGHTAPDYEEDQGVEVWRRRQPSWPGGWIWGRYQMFRQIARWCRQRDIDLVEVPDYAGMAAGWPRLPVPVVSRWHGSSSYFAAEMNQPIQKQIVWLERDSLRRSDFACSVSRYTAQKTHALFGLKAGPDAILYNLLDSPDNGEPSCRRDASVVFSGTLTYKKGVVPLFIAWPHVLAQRKDATLHIYGKEGRTLDGRSMKSMLLAHLNEPQQRSVHFHGHTDRHRLFKALHDARLGVFPSYAESFGLAPAESMAAGCPTIYSQRGCGGELIRDGQDGLLIDPDKPKQLADAIVRLLNDDDLADKLGSAGRRRIEQHFSIDVLLPQNVEFYKQCIARKLGRQPKRNHWKESRSLNKSSVY